MREKCICEKHGDITEKVLFVQYVDKSKEVQIQRKKYYCIECICELLDSFKMPKISLQNEK